MNICRPLARLGSSLTLAEVLPIFKHYRLHTDEAMLRVVTSEIEPVDKATS